MDKVAQYREILKQILWDHAQVKLAIGDVKMDVFFDDERDHYAVFRAGWVKERRVYGALIHIDVIGEKIWIQYDGTEVGVANELTEAGIPKADIVLAYHAPTLRQYNGFAVS